jgi:hypothetical protein
VRFDQSHGFAGGAGGQDAKVIGTVAYRHTHDIDGKPVGMIGVKLSKPGKIKGRAVKNRTFRADELTAVPEWSPSLIIRPRRVRVEVCPE